MDHTSAVAELLLGHGFRAFGMTRSGVGHLLLDGEIDGRPVDIVLDTGAGKSIVELTYCHAEGIAVIDTGDGRAFRLGDVALTLEGMPVRTDGLFAIDMTHTNERLVSKGIDPIRAVVGQDVLRYHQAVIDYAALTLFLKENP